MNEPTQDLTDERIRLLLELDANATPGPLAVRVIGQDGCSTGSNFLVHAGDKTWWSTVENLRLLACLRNDSRAILAELKRRRAEAKAAQTRSLVQTMYAVAHSEEEIAADAAEDAKGETGHFTDEAVYAALKDAQAEIDSLKAANTELTHSLDAAARRVVTLDAARGELTRERDAALSDLERVTKERDEAIKYAQLLDRDEDDAEKVVKLILGANPREPDDPVGIVTLAAVLAQQVAARDKTIASLQSELAAFHRLAETAEASHQSTIATLTADYNAVQIERDRMRREIAELESIRQELNRELGEVYAQKGRVSVRWGDATEKLEAAEATIAEQAKEIKQVSKERDEWHRVVKDCEKAFAAEGTAESPLMSNLANLCRNCRADRDALKAEVERLRAKLPPIGLG